ncbi:MAG: universal stress protein [Caulobacteraceae bacterium]|nr:universal stress protein [Caulobacteraceae bacterium]
MTYAAVLTHVQADPECRARLACAVDVAKRFGAALIGVGAEMIPPLAMDAGYGVTADWTGALRGAIEAGLETARETFEEAAGGLAEKHWRCGLQSPAAAIAATSRAADLIVAGGAPLRRHDPYRDATAAELAVTSGRPVLAAPPNPRPPRAERILLAWKDTREARRAMADAMPFFEKAERVVVAALCPKADAEDAAVQVEDVAKALARRGVNAAAKVVETRHPDGYQLLALAAQEGADLVVAGAYGHSRLGEWVFGGVTQDLLSQDQLHVLLSH